MYHECESTKHGKRTFESIKLLFDCSNLETGQRKRTQVKLSFMPHPTRIKRFSLAFETKVGFRMLCNDS